MPNARISSSLEASGSYLPNSSYNPHHAPPERRWVDEDEVDVEFDDEESRVTLPRSSVPFPLIRPAAWTHGPEIIESTPPEADVASEAPRAGRRRRIFARILFALIFGAVLALLAYEISIANPALLASSLPKLW